MFGILASPKRLQFKNKTKNNSLTCTHYSHFAERRFESSIILIIIDVPSALSPAVCRRPDNFHRPVPKIPYVSIAVPDAGVRRWRGRGEGGLRTRWFLRCYYSPFQGQVAWRRAGKNVSSLQGDNPPSKRRYVNLITGLRCRPRSERRIDRSYKALRGPWLSFGKKVVSTKMRIH